MTEKELHEKTGVPRAVLRKLRDRLPNGEYESQQGKGVFYTDTGLRLVCKLLGIVPGDLQVREERKVWAQVIKVPGNRTLLICEMVTDQRGKALDGMLRVKCKNNGNFRPGMLVPVREVVGDTAWLARPCPRYPGVW